MSINKRFFKLLEDENIAPVKFCKDTGISTKTVSAWKTRETDPPAKLISTIADYFGVSLSFLLTGSEASTHDVLMDESLIQKYNALAKDEKKEVDSFINFKYSYSAVNSLDEGKSFTSQNGKKATTGSRNIG